MASAPRSFLLLYLALAYDGTAGAAAVTLTLPMTVGAARPALANEAASADVSAPLVMAAVSAAMDCEEVTVKVTNTPDCSRWRPEATGAFVTLMMTTAGLATFNSVATPATNAAGRGGTQVSVQASAANRSGRRTALRQRVERVGRVAAQRDGDDQRLQRRLGDGELVHDHARQRRHAAGDCGHSERVAHHVHRQADARLLRGVARA